MQRISYSAIVLFAACVVALNFLPSPRSEAQIGGLNAPRGFEASNGSYTTKVGMTWNPVRSATNYRIFRATSDNPASAVEVGSTVAPFFFDTTATASTNFFYWVRAENASETSDFSQSALGVRAVGNPGGPAAPLEPPLAPTGNNITAAKVALGKVLFWEEQLSATQTVACGTCHINGTGGSDPRSISTDPGAVNPGVDGVFGTGDDSVASPGVPHSVSNDQYSWLQNYRLGLQVTSRKANPAINAGYAPSIFWDGRAVSTFRDPVTDVVVLNNRAALESQSAGPPASEVEMGHVGRDWTAIASQIENAEPLLLADSVPAAMEEWIGGRSYPEMFEEAFGSPEVTPAKIAMAIATYERNLFSDRTPMDLVFGGRNVLTQQEQRGRGIFNNVGCGTCHGGTLFTNNAFFYIGVRPQNDDLGRFNVTGLNNDRGSFKVPSLRNVELRAPYMHNGRFNTLEEVVDFYDRGGDFDAPNKAVQINPLGLSPQQKADLVAFLRRPMTDPRVGVEAGPFSRPTLYSESSRVPAVSGTGRVGTRSLEPEIIAIEPPYAGNSSFTVGLQNALPEAEAVLVIDTSDPGVGATIPASGALARVTTTTIDTLNTEGYASVNISIPAAANGNTYFGRWYVVDSGAANGFAVSKLVTFTVFGNAVVPSARTRFDFDGDAKADVSIFRPGAGEWWYLRSTDGGNGALQFGASGFYPLAGDYTGDGKADAAYWREDTGEWFVVRSEDSTYYAFPFGTAGDIPAPGDFDGDGKLDAAVFRPSAGTWFILRSTDGGVETKAFGSSGDKPLIGDYDNDGKDDVGIYRPQNQQFWLNRSTAGVIAYQLGATGDQPFAADFTGDGTDDVGFFRPATGEWFVLRSDDQTYFAFPFGATGDIPAPADYDGDGVADATVFRSATGTWYSNQSTSGVVVTPFGTAGDVPVPSAYVVID
ncbi:MAG: cytochrome c peroxidase [Pyrinomonadaceae bacterium]